VPGLGFTNDGCRIGRGKGYYDRFFANCGAVFSKSPYKIGLAFNEQVIDKIPTTPLDVYMDLVVSEHAG